MQQPTCVSAPGKVLLAGGYLVLHEQYTGIVLSTTARFYAQVNSQVIEPDTTVWPASRGWRPLFPLLVESEQFKQLIDGWIEEKRDGRSFRFQLRKSSHRNVYIENTVLCAVNGIAGLEEFKSEDAFRRLAETKKRVHVRLRGDNDFYSQVQRLQDAKQPLCRDSLKTLEAFLPPTIEERDGELVALKTGMGSSAALVTSLVAALVTFFVPTISFEERQRDLELVHNLAQLCHCYVQRKIGSGFDVSAACFGSQLYSRFPVSVLNTFTFEDAIEPQKIAPCIKDHALWNTSNRVKSVRLPSTFHILMGDVSSGSATVSMVRQVLKWQNDQPKHAARVIDAIHRHIMDVERGFAEICDLETNYTKRGWKDMAAVNRDQWGTIDTKIGAALMRVSAAYAGLRQLMREMGTSAGVSIEPPEQTAILDATLAIPGVLLAGVPGAGGYDAICVIVLHESVLQAVEDLWVRWSSAHPDSVICPLLCDVDRGVASSLSARSGLRMHACSENKWPHTSINGKTNHPNRSHAQALFDGYQPSTQNLMKRKTRDGDSVEEDRKEKTSCQLLNIVKTDRTEQEQPGHFSICGLRFGTESWAGMKTSNEDRHVSFVDYFPGPVFGIFDGHGGTFSADFLSRQLVKTAASVIRQVIGEKALAGLRCSRAQSMQEKARKVALDKEATTVRRQLEEVEAMRSVTTATASESSADDLHVLADQLSKAIADMDSEAKQIEVEEAERRRNRWQWCSRLHSCFLKSFRESFRRVDSQILQKNTSQDGSTALLVWFLADSVNFDDDETAATNGENNNTLSFYTINVGDCRAVMCRGGRGVPLTSDHKPDRPDERQRIEKAGGYVGKIAGISRVYSAAGAGLSMRREASTHLAVSRAFGDQSLKHPAPLVSCEPEVARFQVLTDDLFLILACDGIWDVMSEQDAVDIALPHFHDAKAAADAIVKAAYKKGSLDNLTATVVQFAWKTGDQLQQAIDTSKVTKARTCKSRQNLASADSLVGSDDEIDMFNL
uniref:phosphomevalonate kinase n=1 Tax=Peronospora matthiolae TaxID=2874970 RepID=A0AAV1T3S7_9STRA